MRARHHCDRRDPGRRADGLALEDVLQLLAAALRRVVEEVGVLRDARDRVFRADVELRGLYVLRTDVAREDAFDEVAEILCKQRCQTVIEAARGERLVSG